GIHTLSGAKILEQCGFKRVVLSRETKLTDIQLIKQFTNLEIEYFVQGALCIAFSGNCYLSSLKNGNSGNRGKCLQLCRLPYQVYDGQKLLTEGYYLSARDLCLMHRLQALKEAGVDSLKIEGRLKRASYVAQVTHSYRQVLDNFGACDIEKEKVKISELFSRGAFNEQAYLDNNFNIINPKIGHHQGKKIGYVITTTKFKNIYKITLQLKERLGQNDAIRLVQGKRQFSIGVGNVNDLGNGKYEIFSTQNIPAGYDVYLLKSAAKEKVLTDFEKHLLVNFYLIAKSGMPVKLIAKHDKLSVAVIGEKALENARTAGITYDQVAKQLSKLNDTKFSMNHLECDLDDVFITVGELNAIRRKAITELEETIIRNYNETLPNIVENNQSCQPVINAPGKNFYLISDCTDLGNVNLRGFSIILAPCEYSASTVNDIVAALITHGIDKKDIYLNLPTVATEPEMKILDEILSQQKIGIIANNYAHLRWVKQYRTVAGIGMNVYNQYTAATLLNLGCENIIWSIECNTTPNYGSALVSGYPALMTFCHCPIREVYGSNCAKCRYHTNLIYQD
ncbi:MAG: U32 family peptidase, partial [Clostridia bacterium]|nr:U32 family peptidase [Clostridia bacterium]